MKFFVNSSLQSARQGFALALASVVGALPSIDGAAIVKMVDKHLEATSSMKGQVSVSDHKSVQVEGDESILLYLQQHCTQNMTAKYPRPDL